MTIRNEADVKSNVGAAGGHSGRAALPFIPRLDKWIQWRAEKLQGVRQEIIARTRPAHNSKPAERARAAGRG
ncbi:MAG TPA: hypothetical protein VJ464_02435 [Blastocatellia bacterium]|nr:hypothetical protein [Blastocatellia bacterium]